MRKTILIFIFLPVTAAGFSQNEKLIVPTDLKQQTIVTEPVTLRKGFFRAGLLLNYRVADRYFNGAGEKDYYRTSSWGSQSAYGITFNYGISDRLQIDLISEYLNTLQETQNTEIIAVTSKSETETSRHKGIGLGDSHLALKYQIVPEGNKKISFTGRVEATLPTGEKNPKNISSENQYDLPVGDGTYALNMNVSARKVIYPYSFTGYLDYTINFNGKKLFNTTDITETRFRLGNMFETGLSCNLHLNEWIVFSNEINYFNEKAGRKENLPVPQMPASWALSYEPGLIFQVHRFRLGESVRIPVRGKNVPADPLYVLLAQYVF